MNINPSSINTYKPMDLYKGFVDNCVKDVDSGKILRDDYPPAKVKDKLIECWGTNKFIDDYVHKSIYHYGQPFDFVKEN